MASYELDGDRGKLGAPRRLRGDRAASPSGLSRQEPSSRSGIALRGALLNWRQSLVTIGVLLIWGGAVWILGGLK